MSSILITGSAGFIGSFLAEKLVDNGYKVIGVDNLFRGKEENLSAIISNPSFSFVNIDLSNPINKFQLAEIMQKNNIEIVFHLAAVNGTQYFYDNPVFVLDQNIKITMNLLESIENTSVKKIIYTSSSEIYGDPMNIPTSRSHPILLNINADRDSYASSKAIGEFYTRLFSKKFGIDYLILRVFNMFGPRMVNTRYGQVIPEFIHKTLNKEIFTIIGDGCHTRSFCYIKDFTNIMIKLLENKISGVLNIGNDEEISILSLAERIHYLMRRNFNPVFLPERPHDHKRRRPDITELKKILPENNFTSLENGLLETIKFYSSEMAEY